MQLSMNNKLVKVTKNKFFLVNLIKNCIELGANAL